MKTGINFFSVLIVLFLGVLVSGVAILKSTDLYEYKDLISEKAREATGRDLVITGDLNLEISFTPKIVVEGIAKGIGSGLKSLLGN
ncbi:MAG: hypothetical protein QMB78_06100 [Rhodospirillales bacterium]